jgi:hypothetical protein
VATPHGEALSFFYNTLFAENPSLKEKSIMKSILTIVFFALISTGFAQQKEFNWLLGTWKLKDKNIYERWSLASDGKSFEGLSFRVKEKDTIVTEKIRFMFDGSAFHYMPDVAGPQGEIDFKITTFSSTSFVAENPQHDFPKLIRYAFVRKEGRDYLEAAIEGNGKVIPYNYERLK